MEKLRAPHRFLYRAACPPWALGTDLPGIYLGTAAGVCTSVGVRQQDITLSRPGVTGHPAAIFQGGMDRRVRRGDDAPVLGQFSESLREVHWATLRVTRFHQMVGEGFEIRPAVPE
jgi:hypothetical protein